MTCVPTCAIPPDRETSRATSKSTACFLSSIYPLPALTTASSSLFPTVGSPPPRESPSISKDCMPTLHIEITPHLLKTQPCANGQPSSGLYTLLSTSHRSPSPHTSGALPWDLSVRLLHKKILIYRQKPRMHCQSLPAHLRLDFRL